MRRSDSERVADMLVEIDDAIEFVEGFDVQSFLADRRTMKTVACSIQITGGGCARHLDPVQGGASRGALGEDHRHAASHRARVWRRQLPHRLDRRP